MSNPFSHIDNSTNRWRDFFERLKKKAEGGLRSEKLKTPVGYLLLTFFALAMGFVLASLGDKLGMVFIIGLWGIPVLLACLFQPRFGIIFTTTTSYFILGIKKYLPGDVPLGLLLDVLMLLMFFGLLIRLMPSRDWRFAQNPVSFMVLIWIVYNFVELINPAAASQMAWFYTVRSMAGLLLLYYIALYAFDSLDYVKSIIKLFIALSLLAALYGLKQEFFGLNSTELAWLHSDKETFELIFQWGRIRIFSFLSDPTAFGILMAYMGIFCYLLIPAPIANWKRVGLFVAGSLMMMTMAYSGTRTAFVIPPIAILFYAFLTLNKRVLIGTAVFFMFGTLFMMKSTSNPVIYRIQSAFKFKQDASMQLRLDNQAFIQPFIQAHPLGGGLGSTGIWGKRFSPNSPLANFPPDSGYVRTAVEQGWLGLLLYCTLLFVVFYCAIRYYVRLQNPEVKAYFAALFTILFCLTMANYPQEAIILLPNSIIFYLTIAALMRLKDFDTPLKNQQLNN